MRARTTIVHPTLGEIIGKWIEDVTESEIQDVVDAVKHEDLTYLVVETGHGKVVIRKEVLSQSIIRIDIVK